MDIQLILALILGLGAFLYILKKIIREFHHSEADPSCEDCEVNQSQDKWKKK